MANYDELCSYAYSRRWQDRVTPLERGRSAARKGRSRDSNPFSEFLPQSREDWFAGWDQIKLEK